MMEWIVKAIGVGIVLLALIDIFLTVLYPRSGKGWISVPLSQLVWRCFRIIAKAPFLRYKQVLSYCGPTLIVMVLLVWVLLLISGFALIIWSDLGFTVQASQGKTPINFATAFYYSGYVLTTLGIGDIVPKTDGYRFLTILEAGLGFSVFTLTLTYLLAVYSALAQRNVFALSLHHQTSGNANAAELLTRLGAGADFTGARQDLAIMAGHLLLLLESHHAYPILHYFRFQEPYYALGRISLLTMDTVTLIRTALDKDVYRSLIYSTAVAELGDGGQHLLVELSNSFLPKSKLISQGQPESVLREWYYQAVERLKQEGIQTTADLEAGADLYVCLRQEWEPYVMTIAHYMGFDWSEIAPAEARSIRLRRALSGRL